jgi:hypothetical protein
LRRDTPRQVHTGKKKMYIKAELEPSAELTGGLLPRPAGTRGRAGFFVR